MANKPKLATCSLAGCFGCHMSVLDIDERQINPPPPLGASVDTSFILGMGKVKDEVKILLDIDKVLAGRERAGVLESVPREPD